MQRGPEPSTVRIQYAALSTVLLLALLIAGSGVLSVLTDTDPIGERGAGYLTGVFMHGALLLVAIASFLSPTLVETPMTPAVTALRMGAWTVGCWGAFVVVGAVSYGVVRGNGEAIVRFLLDHTVSGYTILAVVSYLVVAAFYVMLVRSRPRPRPKWPWEED